MYKVGDVVLYSLNTICRISEITTRNFSGVDLEYYILRPVYDDNATIYVPVNNDTLKKKMRNLLSKEEIYQLIRSMPTADCIWIEDEHKRKEVFHEIIANGERTELIKLIKTLYLHQQEQQKNNSKRKLHISDERFFKDAEKLLYDEFAFVLEINPQQVMDFINQELSKMA